jgi:hypothetical protein
MKTKRLRLFWLTGLLVVLTVGAGAQSPDFPALLRTIDAQSNFSSRDFAARIRFVSDDPQEGRDVKAARTFRRDRDDSFLILFLEPESQLGQGYLRLEDNLWFYDPESRKFSRTSMKENMPGTDAKNSDFGLSSLAGDYAVTGSTTGKLGAFEVWYLDLEATNDEATYPFKRIAVSKKDGLLLKSEDYSLSRRLLRTAYYTSYVRVGDQYVADKVLLVDALVKGKKTELTRTEISVEPLPDAVFTKAYVERVNR